ncbi:oxidoreductase [Chaetomidium leptoderma]|uniref:D-xylose 1-dehydrogenase (NADP(+), D-xylono-1,5-lactone-forming) n=1 Tax=Chaetomidium leptoderma TaxID=669021 RepID=A0AAN6VSM7_9PEZI|nr:oxidoreductase [Chaetomidium leptoderma]
MASSTPYTVRWGIMATGGIAEVFTKDLLTNPATRDVHDVRHEVAAAASSSSKDRAAEFLNKVKAPSSAKSYGSYHELVADADIDIIYVATPHSHHFQNAMLALEAGKNVLCEKALTVTASQARKLVETARAKGVFFMEAVWTRYFPLSIQVRDLISSGAIGNVYRTIADLSIGNAAPDGKLTFADSNRMVNPDLAGGALLDLGIYALTWVFQTLYHVQPEAEKEAPNVMAAVNKYHTGADETTSIIVQFPKHKSHGIALTSLRVGSNVDGKGSGGAAIRIQGSTGEIQVFGPAYCPLQYKVIKKDGGGKVEVVDCPIPKDAERDGWGQGMFWEADECARCLRDGKKESKSLPWSESIAIMEVMEETLRQGEVVYPEAITTDVFDAQGPLNTGKRSAEADADAYERTHVHGVYEAIAPHFSATRYKPWPAVASFLRSQVPGAVGLDVGCGNGKYLGVNPEVLMVGSDRSPSLVTLARGRCKQLQAQQVLATDVLVADGLSLPFRERAADFAICVAVIHHMSTRARRQEAIRQLLRCVRLGEAGTAGGQVLVYVWALEQGTSRRGWEEGGEQDLLVPWVLKSQQKQQKTPKGTKVQGIGGVDAANKSGEAPPTPTPTPAAPAEPEAAPSHTDPVFQRYYHLYRKGELEEDVLAVGGVVVTSGYERDNWWVVAANEPAHHGQH